MTSSATVSRAGVGLREETHPSPPGPRRRLLQGKSTAVELSLVMTYLSIIVLIPLAAVVWRSQSDGLSGFFHAITTPEAASTLKLTIVSSVLVAAINMVMGTAIAWVLVRDKLPGRTLFDTLIDLHVSLAQEGWVAVDLYDGCLIVDFSTAALKVVDLDSYRRGATTNDMGRMFGATRFMAPEEFALGAPIDQRTTVFTLGRLVRHFGTRLSEELDELCGPPDLASIVGRATSPDRDDRYADVAEFAGEWFRARTP